MKRVLVISYYWPPSGGSGVQRWVKMCKYLLSCGWQPVVYTPENPALTATDGTLEGDVPPEVEVIRHPILEPGHFAKKSTDAQVTPINAGKKTLRQRIAMWIRGNCFVPDPRVVWVRPSVLWLTKYLRKHPVDAIISTGPPHSMHLIAKSLSARTGLPWIADFRDPWTRMFYFKHLSLTSLSERRHKRLEKSVLDAATRVVAVSPFVQEEFRQMTDTQVELITNGFDEDDFPAREAGTSKPAHFTILHAGLFAADGNPDALWRAMEKLTETDSAFASSLRLVLCGKTDREVLDSITGNALVDYMENLGYLDHNEVVRHIADASVLLLPLRKEPEYRATLPGKLFEYLASRRPILGIGQKDGAMAAVLRETGAGDVFDWTEENAIYEWLKDKFNKFREGGLQDNAADLSRYTRKNLAKAYAVLLDFVCKSGK